MNREHSFLKRKLKSKTDWNRVKHMTEREIIAAAKADLDAQPLTTAELKQFKPV